MSANTGYKKNAPTAKKTALPHGRVFLFVAHKRKNMDFSHPPEYIPREVVPVWYEATAHLIAQGHTNPAYLLTVEMYCRLIALERQAFREAVESGLPYRVQTRRGDKYKPHPVWRIYLNIQQQARRVAKDLLLTPAEHQRITRKKCQQ